MKLRTSYFNSTVFRKNISRFAPVWGLYTLCLIMGLMILGEGGTEYWLVENLSDCIQIMPPINMVYALVCAMVLFGDLYNSRLCNALHAMPLRREGWFATNVASGLLFSLVPSLVMTALALPMCAMSVVTNGWQVALYWLLGTNLQFIAFFGIAVFSAFCVGSRFAMAVVYGLLNFGSAMAYWMVDTLYTPMLYGVETNSVPFAKLFPLEQMLEDSFIECTPYRSYFGEILSGTFTVTEAWGTLWLWAAVGVLLGAVALELYRRRKLETAGDFIAVKPLEPVFLVVYTLAVGIGCHFVCDQMLGIRQWFWLFIGLAVGFFTGRMLLERTVRVFRKKNWLACGGVLLAMAATLLIPAFDLLGIESWIPEKDEVKSVSIYSGHYHLDNVYATVGYQECITLTEEADIEKVLTIHQRALDERGFFSSWENSPSGYYEAIAETYGYDPSSDYKPTLQFTLRYELENGRIVHRYYHAYAISQTGEDLQPWLSSFQMVMGMEESDIPTFAREANTIYLDGNQISDDLTEAEIQELLEAIALDCAEGNMAQRWVYHGEYESCTLEFEIWEPYLWRNINVYEDSHHTMQWLLDHGFKEYMYIYNEEFTK